MSSDPHSSLSIPDTGLVREADLMVRNALGEPLYRHSLRSYFLAANYADRKGIRFDRENLTLAFLFHDIGFCEPYRKKGSAFQVNSSRALRDFLSQRAVAPERIVPLMEAIELHMQLWPRWARGNEVALVHIGAWMDVTGLRIRKTDRSLRRDVRVAYPKNGFFPHFSLCLLRSMTGVRPSLGIMMPSLCREAHHFDISSRA